MNTYRVILFKEIEVVVRAENGDSAHDKAISNYSDGHYVEEFENATCQVQDLYSI